jgi:hypothetical protein
MVNNVNPDAAPPENLPVDPGNPWIEEIQTGSAWRPDFSFFTLPNGQIIWQMTIRCHSSTMTVRATKEGAEKFLQVLQASIQNASPLLMGMDKIPDTAAEMFKDFKKPPGGQQ